MKQNPLPTTNRFRRTLALKRERGPAVLRRNFAMLALSFGLQALTAGVVHAQATHDKVAPANPQAEIQAPNASVVGRAMTLLGIPYRFGGSSPDAGFDCSGLVRFVFREALGVSLPGRADQIGKSGEKLDVSNLLPGDLVFFNTLRRSMSHVGIYLGNREFLHAPSTGGVVRVDKLDLPYWIKRFEGARRMVQHEDQAVTLPGVLPDKAHGSEVLAGMAGGHHPETAAVPEAPGATTPVATASVTTMAAPRKPRSAETGKDSGKPTEPREHDPLDSFIRKLSQKH